MKLTACLLVFICFAIHLLAQVNQKRLALVIGNSAYQHGGVLRNPVNDAALIAQTLKDLGFDIIKETDVELKDMQTAFKDFVNRLDDYDVALFFYAGHGLQVDGQNYLIPVDAELKDKLSIEFEAFKVSTVNKYFANNDDKLNIMILDACRNNPYRAWMRGGGQGFSAIESQGAGTIIAFATREGETASDGTGSYGLFTQYLVEQMKIPQNITDVFQNTRVEVLKASNKQQVPQEWNMLTGNFYFTQTASTLEEVKINDNPVLISGEVNIDYGSIKIDTQISGDLYLDGKKLGYLEANSTGNQLNKIKIGTHTVLIVGSQTLTREIRVYKERVSLVTFEITKDDLSSARGGLGHFTDSRDGKTYPWVRIGKQVWMAENLDYQTEGSKRNEMGMLYTWEAAMKACPDGWHLPSDKEWNILFYHVVPDVKALRSTSGWTMHNNGTNSSGFTGIPAGYATHRDGKAFGFGIIAIFWTSNEKNKRRARMIRLLGESFAHLDMHKDSGHSCRCIRD